MTFNYNTLKQAAKEGQRLGRWKELPVFSSDKQGLAQKGNGAFYVVYDDNNAFVKKSGSMWFRYGYLDKEGSVHEDTTREYFVTPKPKAQTASFEYNGKKAEVKYAHTTTTNSPGPMADVKMELDVESTLQKAREMSIEDLLKGFDYGL